jgi:hypothetical protein
MCSGTVNAVRWIGTRFHTMHILTAMVRDKVRFHTSAKCAQISGRDSTTLDLECMGEIGPFHTQHGWRFVNVNKIVHRGNGLSSLFSINLHAFETN